MKKLLPYLLAGACAFGFGPKDSGCESAFPMRQGVSFELSSYNAKNKLQSVARYKVLSARDLPDGTEATVHSDIYDEKEKLISSADYTVQCKGGTFYMDMKSFLNPETMKAYQEMEVKVEGAQLEYPQAMSPGENLPDGQMKVTISQQGNAFSTLDMAMKDRKVTGTESVTVPIGTLQANTVESAMEMNTVTVGIKVPVRVKLKEWVAPGKGVVRSEAYDKNGKLQSYTVMSKLSS